ncbi:MAG: universal stress protein [Thermoplasmatales archaeon]|jgi:Universal stress protein UspA and related nucleotide-binding proteins
MEKKERGILPIERILVAVDGSKPSMRALDMAISLSKLNKNMKLYIVMAIPYPVQYVTGENPTGDITLLDRMNTLKEKGEQILENSKNYAISNGVMNVETFLKQGDPAKEILNVSKTVKPDLIVIGNRRRGFLKGVFLGSVSQRVAANSDVSVLVVK